MKVRQLIQLMETLDEDEDNLTVMLGIPINLREMEIVEITGVEIIGGGYVTEDILVINISKPGFENIFRMTTKTEVEKSEV